MERFIINGGQRLQGELTLQGAKNSVLPIIAATLITKSKCIIRHVPRLCDVEAELEILELLGCKIHFSEGTLTVDSKDAVLCEIPPRLMKAMRSSVIFLGAMLSRFGEAFLSFPGGCNIGSRPIDYHLSLLKDMGAQWEISEEGALHALSPRGLQGGDFILPYPSVGATENALLGAVLAKGKTVIENAAKEPEIVDLADFLNRCGANIYGAGQSTVIVHGVTALHGCEHTVIPDRIMAATFLGAAAITGGKVLLHNTQPAHLLSVLPVFEAMGCKLQTKENQISLKSPRVLKAPGIIRTNPFPAFPTDCQPIFMALATKAKGVTVITERVFENRFLHVPSMRRFGAEIETENNAVAVIEGVDRLYGAREEATDLRGGTALVLMGLGATGQSIVTGLGHIDRGCEKMEKQLSALGADIKRIS